MKKLFFVFVFVSISAVLSLFERPAGSWAQFDGSVAFKLSVENYERWFRQTREVGEIAKRYHFSCYFLGVID